MRFEFCGLQSATVRAKESQSALTRTHTNLR